MYVCSGLEIWRVRSDRTRGSYPLQQLAGTITIVPSIILFARSCFVLRASCFVNRASCAQIARAKFDIQIFGTGTAEYPAGTTKQVVFLAKSGRNLG